MRNRFDIPTPRACAGNHCGKVDHMLAQDIERDLVESQEREVVLRKALNRAINGLQEWCDDVDQDASWDGWDNNFKQWKYGGIKELEQALMQPAPPCIQLNDVTPLVEALQSEVDRYVEGCCKELRAILSAFLAKHPIP